MAQGLFDEVIEISERLGDRRRWDDGVTNLVMVNYFQGEFARAVQLADDLYASSSTRGDADNQAWALMERTFCALVLDDLEAAATSADRLQALFEGDAKIIDEPLKIGAFGALAMARLRHGQLALAQQAAGQADQLIARSTPTSYPALMGYAGLAEMYLTLWGQELETQGPNPKSQYKAAARRAVKALHKFSGTFPIGWPRTWLWQGRLEWLSGNRAAARQAWTKCLAHAEKLMMPYPAALAHAELGRHPDVDEAERQQHLSRAHDLFTQLGASADLAHLPERLEAQP